MLRSAQLLVVEPFSRIIIVFVATCRNVKGAMFFPLVVSSCHRCFLFFLTHVDTCVSQLSLKCCAHCLVFFSSLAQFSDRVGECETRDLICFWVFSLPFCLIRCDDNWCAALVAAVGCHVLPCSRRHGKRAIVRVAATRRPLWLQKINTIFIDSDELLRHEKLREGG